MVAFQPDKIKEDRLGDLKWCLRLYGQAGRNMGISSLLLAVKAFSFLLQTGFVLTSLSDLTILADIATTYPVPLLATLKMLVLLWQHRRVDYLYGSVENDFWDTNSSEKATRTRIQTRFKMVNWILVLHFFASMSVVLLYVTFPFISMPPGQKRRLPTLIYFPVDTDQSPLHEILAVMLTWNMFMSVIGNVLYDFLFVYAAQHLRAQFIILKEKLENLTVGAREGLGDCDKFQSRSFQNQIRKRIRICVRHHNVLIRYGNELKKFSSVTLGMQLLVTFATLVLAGYIITQDLREIMKSAILTGVIFASCLELIIFALQCSELHYESSSVPDAAFQCKWYLLRAPLKRELTLLIMNSQSGFTVLGYGLFPINNRILVTMGQNVVSSITLLRSLKETSEA